MISMTERAASKIRMLLAEKRLAEGALRVKVVGGGCSGLTYRMDRILRGRSPDFTEAGPRRTSRALRV